MDISLIYRICCCLAAGSLLLLFGCQQFLGGEKNILTPEVIKYSVPTDTPSPPVKAVPAEQSLVPETRPSPPAPPLAPPVEEKLLPRQLAPQTPEGLSPAPAPAPNKPQPQASVGVRKPLTVSKTQDFSYRDQLLTEDTTWHGEVLIEGGLTVAPQATLTIEPGTVVRFRQGADAGTLAVLVIQGRIQANGSNEKPVLFTSSYAEPLTGDWQGIVILASDKKNLVTSSRVEGAETGLDSLFSSITVNNVRFEKCRTGLRVQDSLFIMNGGGSRDCLLGAGLTDSEADIRDASFSANSQGVVALRTSLSLAGTVVDGNASRGLKASDCRIRISGCRFTANGSGLILTASEGIVAASAVTGNRDYGLFLNRSRMKVSGNEIATNDGIGLQVDDGEGVAWGNVLFANGTYDLYNAGTDEFRAIGNWWGEKGVVDPARRIYDNRQDVTRGRVYYAPVLSARPKIGS